MAAKRSKAPIWVIFDVDGTLLDYEKAAVDTFNEIIKKACGEEVGAKYDWDFHAQIVGTQSSFWSVEALKLLNIKPSQLTPKQLESRVHEITLTKLDELVPIEGAFECVLDCVNSSRVAGVAVATSSHRAELDLKLDSKILSKMDAIVTGDEIEFGKPNPDIFLEAINRLGADPARTVVFEDSPHGCTAALAAGCVTIALPDPRMPTNASRFDQVHKKLGGYSDLGDSVVDALIELVENR